jgi:hypothetical protein
MKKQDIELYLKQYPSAWKWLNQCTLCNDIGYKPEMPEETFPGNRLCPNLRKMFHCLPVNKAGICEQCEKYAQ